MNYINDFLNYLEYERRMSKHTIKNYKNDLLDYYEFHGLLATDLDSLRAYQKHLYDKKYENSTILRKISSLRSFFKYLTIKGVIKSNPMVIISNPKKKKLLPNYLNYDNLEKLLSTPDIKTDKGKRDALILELLYSSGIRVYELVNIKLKDINKNEKKILIHGKGNKERYTYYGSKCESLMEDYIKNVRDKLKPSEYLLANKHGGHLNDRVIRMIVQEYTKISGINVHVTPHTLRHTYATHMLNGGADLKSVGDLLGHENLSTTQIYTHVSNERLRSVYLNAHPRAKR